MGGAEVDRKKQLIRQRTFQKSKDGETGEKEKTNLTRPPKAHISASPFGTNKTKVFFSQRNVHSIILRTAKPKRKSLDINADDMIEQGMDNMDKAHPFPLSSYKGSAV